MRRIEQIHRQQMKVSKDGNNYILYNYLLDDGTYVDSLREYEAGDLVEVWYDDKWDKPKIRKRV